MKRNQADDVQEIYDPWAPNYDNSWHPRFARHMVELIKPQPGEHVLDLACGTGLVSFAASDAAGAHGSVTGVDISSGMLAQAEAKKTRHHLQNVAFYKHSITDLKSLDAIQGKQFDIITCASALVLLPEPGEAVKQWATFLKPGGRLIADVTHPQSILFGIVLEKVGKILERPTPCYRLNFQKPEDLQTVMEAAGLGQVNVLFMSQYDKGSENLEDYIRPSFADPKSHKEFDVAEADGIFDNSIREDDFWTKPLASPPEVRTKAREVFKDEWTKAADSEGKLQQIDEVFMGIGYKPGQ